MFSLRIEQTSWTHRLAVALRFDDHFLGTPVAETLQVSLGGAPNPIPSLTGALRHDDGTYRFIDVPGGIYPLNVQSPSGQWTSLLPLPSVSLPSPAPGQALVLPLWPTPVAAPAAGLTVVRGRVAAAPGVAVTVKGLTVEIAAAGSPFDDHFTRCDANGEFVFILTGALAVDADGRALVAARLDGGAVAVAGGVVVRGTLGDLFAADQFLIRPGHATRVKLKV